MQPSDDPRWPICTPHSLKHWCNGTGKYVLEGKDADDIEPGMRYVVPIVPEHQIFVQVGINTQPVIGEMYQMYVVMPEDVFSQNEELEDVELWTRGEGRKSMGESLMIWATSRAKERCEVGTHGFAEEGELNIGQTLQSIPNIWCMGYYDMCWPCFKKAGEMSMPDITGTLPSGAFAVKARNARVTPLPNTGSSGGLNVNMQGVNYHAPAAMSPQERARAALQQRYNQDKNRF